MANLLTFKMLSGYTRPVVSIAKDVTCLIDTGADTPVWTQGSETLKDVYFVNPVYSSLNNKFVERVYSFTNE